MKSKEYKKIIEKIKSNEDNVYFIHYSCQSLSDDNEGYSPRITSIAVLHKKSYQMHSFSIHLVAERLKVKREEIFERYEELEKQMMIEFFDFVKERIDKAIWLHWNMSNINYGFETLEHRYQILTGMKCVHINENKKFNISNLLWLRYGDNYVKDPKMLSLMEKNGGVHRDFLSGADEVSAYKAKEFVKLHKSTMCKVYFFNSTFDKLLDNKLRTDKNGFWFTVEYMYQSPIIQLLGIVGIIGTICSLVYAICFQ